MKKVGVYIIANKNVYTSLAEALEKYNDIVIGGYTDSIDKAKEYIKNNKTHIIIIQCNAFSRDMCDGFIRFCQIENIKNIALCASVAQGFEFINIGSTDLIVFSDDFDTSVYDSFIRGLVTKLRVTTSKDSNYKNRIYKLNQEKAYTKIIAIGSSTGGVEAVQKLLLSMPADCPPIVIVQHMPPVFTKLYAERLNNLCKISVWEARDEDKLRPGLALMAPGDQHMEVVKKNDGLYVNCYKGEKVGGHCPAVNVLYDSIAKVAGDKTIAVILTGMGADGASGLLNLRKNGALTIGQNQESCVVYGMPKSARDLGAVIYEKHLDEIAEFILKNI